MLVQETLFEDDWYKTWVSQVALVVKNPPANAGDTRDTGSIPGSGRSPGGGHGNPLQYSCLENPMDRGAWWATVHGLTKSQTPWKWLGCLLTPLPHDISQLTSPPPWWLRTQGRAWSSLLLKRLHFGDNWSWLKWHGVMPAPWGWVRQGGRGQEKW